MSRHLPLSTLVSQRTDRSGKNSCWSSFEWSMNGIVWLILFVRTKRLLEILWCSIVYYTRKKSLLFDEQQCSIVNHRLNLLASILHNVYIMSKRLPVSYHRSKSNFDTCACTYAWITNMICINKCTFRSVKIVIIIFLIFAYQSLNIWKRLEKRR